jgi:hypothetical protein
VSGLFAVYLVYVAIDRIWLSGIRPIGRRVYGRWPSCGVDVFDCIFDSGAENVLALHAGEGEAIGVGEELAASLSNGDHLDEAATMQLVFC